MALFGKKKSDDESPADDDGKRDPMPFSPENAQVFFDRAKTVGETGSFEYAMQLWLGGLKHDPSSMYGLEAFLNVAVNFKGKPGKELLSVVDGKTPADKYLDAILAWGLKIADGPSAVRAVEAAAKLNLGEQTHYMGEKAIQVVRGKPKKDLYVRLMKAFGQVQAFDLAVVAGEQAVQMDPSDGTLASDVKNMSAQQTMRKGGFDQTGQEGGFRANIRDLDKQRMLEEADRTVKTEETVDRLIADMEAEYQRRPDDLPTIQSLAKRLLERGRPEDEDRAYRLLMTAFKDTKQFRFRQEAGRIRLRKGRRALMTYRDHAQQNPDNADAQAKYEEAQKKFLSMEIAELTLAVENYPTDLTLKFELGKRNFELGKYDEAIGLLQESKGDSRYRAQSLGLLGRSFQSMGWHDEAIATFRQAIDAQGMLSDELGLELRYGLMRSLADKADSEQDLPSAEDAEKLASQIAIENFSFRDIRQRREELKKLVLSLRQGK
ncbi:MAG: tetratricopeptide repeat protein [Phycisphaerales bacterium]|nr:tetratricopeptide repeat protein [Phycisphaerales bacterium]